MKLCLLSAPAGYGKTSLLAAWLQNTSLESAWLSLEEEDNELSRFMSHFVTALMGIRPSMAATALELLQPGTSSSASSVLIAIINAIANHARDFALVLDDFHWIKADPILQAVAYLIKHQPRNMHLYVATRMTPALPLAQLMASDNLITLSGEELRFTPQEAEEFFVRVKGLQLTAQDLWELDQRTEGWIAGMQMAAHYLRGLHNPSEAVRSFTGRHGFILEYLTSEVLSRQPEEVQSFLLKTSILRHLNGPLCDAVTGAKNGQALLQSFEDMNLFLVPMDMTRRWYRFHPLFRDLLQQRLQRSCPDEIPGLHLRACDWYAQNSLTRQAIVHALAGEDFARAADMVTQTCKEMMNDGLFVTIQQWLEALPDSLVRSRTYLCLIQAWTRVVLGELEGVEPWIQAAMKTLRTQTEDQSQISTTAFSVDRTNIRLIRSTAARVRGDAREAIRHTEAALQLAPRDDVRLQAITLLNLGHGLLMSGSYAAAFEVLGRATSAARTAGHHHIRIKALYLQSQILVSGGEIRQAASLLSETEESVLEREGLASSAFIDIGLGNLAREWNALEEAELRVKRALRLSRVSGDYMLLKEALVGSAKLALSRKDFQAAEEAAEELSRTARQVGSALDLSQVLALQARIRLAQGDLTAARHWAQAFEREACQSTSLRRLEEHLTLARIWTALGSAGSSQPEYLDQARALLEGLLARTQQQERHGNMIEVRILLGLALLISGRKKAAADSLRHALSGAAAQGYLRLFADEGPVLASLILEAIRREGRDGALRPPSPSPEYMQKLLRCLGIEIAAGFEGREGNEGLGVMQPLTRREIEVLRLLAAGRITREISDELVISFYTARTHVKNIYRKLDVHNRVQAVDRAQKLRLLHAG